MENKNSNIEKRELKEKELRKAETIRLFTNNCENPDFPLCIVTSDHSVKYSFVDGEQW